MPGGGGVAGGDGDLVNIVVVAIISFTILLIGVSVLSPVISITGADQTDNGTHIDNQTVRLDGAGNTVDLSGAEYGEDETVLDSRGYAIRLAGSNDSYVESDQDINISSDNSWTVSVGASVNGSASASELSAVSLNARLVISYNRTAGEWRAWYYDESDRASYNLSVSGANQPGSLATVQVVSNGSHVTLYRDNTVSDTVNITGSGGFASAPVNSSSWYGRLDEVRTYDTNLSDSQRQTLVDDPVRGLPDAPTTARVMFDIPETNTEPVFFSPATMRLSNVTYVDGYDGNEMDEGRFAAMGADYKWTDDGPTIRPIEDGDLDGAPVAFVTYTGYDTGVGQLLSGFRSALMLAGLLPVLLVLGYVVVVFRGLEGRR